MSKIKTIIIDDESLSVELIRSYLDAHEDIEIVAECGNGFEALKAIHHCEPDLLFLDIMMPKLNGFEMLELLEERPVVIFSTAYDNYALEAFERNAVDYLLKPYDQERLDAALDKAREKIRLQQKNAPELLSLIKYHQETGELSRIVVRDGSKINIIAVEKIHYLKAMDDYVCIYTAEGKYLKQQTMKYYQKHLPSRDFVRIHRSYILAISQLQKLEAYTKDSHMAILKQDRQLPVSRSGYSRLRELLNF